MCKLCRRIRRRAVRLAALAEGRDSVSRLTPAPLGKALHALQADSRLALTAEAGRPQISRDMRYRDTPSGTSAPPSCPMRRGLLAYHRRDNVPGQIRAQ
jgi:hypothetical protein